MKKNVGFISTRFAGIDGVSLESSKWAEVFERSGHNCFWFAGELDKDPDKSFLVPEAHFKHSRNKWINDQVWGEKGRNPSITEVIHELRSFIKTRLYDFIQKFDIDILIAENALTIPMQIPLGLALAEAIAETQIPTIAHHHDFYWERMRYSINGVSDYLRMAFPPNLPNIEHVVINSVAQEELAHRAGISATIIPNVLNFENSPAIDAKKAKNFRQSIGLKPDDIMILQPSRIVQRKGIEHAIELVRGLENQRCKLVISHEAGDEGFEYAEWIKKRAEDQGVELSLIEPLISDPWNNYGNNPHSFTLLDIYPYADFITYPSRCEGFGNAFLETIYFKKPLLVNRYATFVKDIEPKGFDLVVMDGFLTNHTIQDVREILESPERREKMVNTNYEIAARHFSYGVLRQRLNPILFNFFGESFRPLSSRSSSRHKVIYLKTARQPTLYGNQKKSSIQYFSRLRN